MKMIKMNAADLTGSALTWAAISALGMSPVIAATGICYRSDHGSWVYPNFENQNGADELIESEWIGLERPSKGQKTPLWRAITDSKQKPGPGQSPTAVVSAWGATHSLAVARVLVISHLGPVVDIPAELMPEQIADTSARETRSEPVPRS